MIGTSPTIRFMTWNIHGTIGFNPGFDLAGVIALILRWRPDVIALQEVDSRRPPEGEDAFALLQDALGQHGIPAHSIASADGHYGQILISSFPIINSEIHDISAPEREPRRAIRAELGTAAGPVRVIATHLGLSIRERREQAQLLLALAGPHDMTTVVLGDFNDWFFVGSVRAVLARVLPGRSRFRTFPSFLPLLRLDRIYCRPCCAVRDMYTDPNARSLSDHLPVIADLAVNQS
ncbi:endonuclease/Exonuclease/phosphatase family protein [Methyloceanibacter caenitepidi]|uniref:Endonuclease/Exonuclease/phosphatase family protein n=2 Tax=Methyloceanibacter caenitepidi TaxID=1384459 RepID=A0A0A8JXU3_9HYPH|nr:endonuclease/Exonuclease/phosphatase family protein [Methyloceanibacter caenitepidi]